MCRVTNLDLVPEIPDDTYQTSSTTEKQTDPVLDEIEAGPNHDIQEDDIQEDDPLAIVTIDQHDKSSDILLLPDNSPWLTLPASDDHKDDITLYDDLITVSADDIVQPTSEPSNSDSEFVDVPLSDDMSSDNGHQAPPEQSDQVTDAEPHLIRSSLEDGSVSDTVPEIGMNVFLCFGLFQQIAQHPHPQPHPTQLIKY